MRRGYDKLVKEVNGMGNVGRTVSDEEAEAQKLHRDQNATDIPSARGENSGLACQAS